MNEILINTSGNHAWKHKHSLGAWLPVVNVVKFSSNFYKLKY